MNIIAQLEYELAYYDSAVHRFNHYTTRTPHYSYGTFFFWVFHTNFQVVNFLKANHLRSSELFYVFMHISAVLWSVQFQFFLWFLTTRFSFLPSWEFFLVPLLYPVFLTFSRSFLSSLARSQVLSIFLFFSFISVLLFAEMAKSSFWQLIVFSYLLWLSHILDRTIWYGFTSTSQRILHVLFSMTCSDLCRYHL